LAPFGAMCTNGEQYRKCRHDKTPFTFIIYWSFPISVCVETWNSNHGKKENNSVNQEAFATAALASWSREVSSFTVCVSCQDREEVISGGVIAFDSSFT
jgi:hypothetical protein